MDHGPLDDAEDSSQVEGLWDALSSAQASHPGLIRVNFIRWLLHYPMWPLIWAGMLVVFISAAMWFHWSFWIPAVLLLLANGLYWWRLRRHFLHGDAMPGLVIALDPMLIAAATDLTQGLGNYPVIKIIKKRLGSIAGQEPEVGSRLICVATYMMDPDNKLPHWRDVDPVPVECATGSRSATDRLMVGVPGEQWEQLHDWLSQVPIPYRPGLYRIRTSTASWKKKKKR